MPVLDLLHVQDRLDIIHAILRRIHDDILPRSQSRIDRAGEVLNSSMSCQVASTERLLDPDAE